MTDLKPEPTGYAIKLVRDKTPDLINSSGESGALFYAKTGKGNTDLLCKKLMEEVAEYLISRGDDELMDIMAVVEALAICHEWKSAEDFLYDSQADKRGGFLEGVVMYGYHPEFDGK